MTVDVVTQLTLVPLTAIKPYFRNPRQNEKTVAKLVQLLPLVGFNVPLVLDRDNVIVKGHARWAAAVQLQMPELPCVYSDADPDTIRADRLADNRVAEFAQWEEDLLRAELTMVGDTDLGALLSTLEFELKDPIPPAAPAATTQAPDGSGPGGQSLAITEYTEVTCNKCGNSMFIRKDGKAAA
jgi:ParB-like chromosome segregation protein Spo0J